MIPFETAQRMTNESLNSKKQSRKIKKLTQIIDKNIAKACKIGLKETEFSLFIEGTKSELELYNQIINLLDTQYSIQGYDFIGEYIDWKYSTNIFQFDYGKYRVYEYKIIVKWDKNYYQKHKEAEYEEQHYRNQFKHTWTSKSLDDLIPFINNK